ncbi:MAG: hypothetical protein PHN69_07620 [Candidatus Pacebacteria bacterium]|nr:hypothetical protein [Candidatus Paceibacterota bacterium]
MTECTSVFQGVKFLVSNSAYQNAVAVTTSDTVDLAVVASALYIGVAGDVKVDMEGSGSGIVFKAVPVGYLTGRFTRVYTNGTSATNIVAVW